MNRSENAILIIDDDTRNIFALSALLKARKYTVVSATSMLVAYKVMEQHKMIGVILMDIMMPDLDGYHAIFQLKNNPLYKHIPLIAVTAQAMAGDREKCLAAGADNYLSKPVDVDALLHVLDTYI
jgi:two-component system, cell cycle response regulator DivK